MRKLCKWCWRRPLKTLSLILLLAFLAVNFLAYQHAYAMTHMVEQGASPGRPESLSLGSKASLLLFGAPAVRRTNDATPASVSLPYETHQFPGTAGKLEAWFIPHEKARGVVAIFHGYLGSKAKMLPAAKGFHRLGYACFVVDCRACGASEGNATTIGFHEADDVAAAASYIRQHWPDQSVLLFGQSMGAAAVLRAVAELGVQADALVLECPFDRMLTAVRARFRAFGMPSYLVAETLVCWGGWQHGFNAFDHNPVDYAQHVTCPVLLLHGAIDPRVQRSEALAVFDALPGKKTFYVFDGLGHESYVNRRPEVWDVQVKAFLTEHGLRQ